MILWCRRWGKPSQSPSCGSRRTSNSALPWVRGRVTAASPSDALTLMPSGSRNTLVDFRFCAASDSRSRDCSFTLGRLDFEARRLPQHICNLCLVIASLGCDWERRPAAKGFKLVAISRPKAAPAIALNSGWMCNELLPGSSRRSKTL